MVTGRVGHSCACAGAPNKTSNATAANSRRQDLSTLQDFARANSLLIEAITL
jgi:hypothetical protein